MKEKIIKLLKSKLLFAALINITVMAIIILITSFSYDNGDDFYNSLYICQRHFYYNDSINYIFAIIVGSIQFILPNFNCFVLSQILLSCVGFITITFVFADKFGKWKGLFFSILINCMFAFDHYANILSNKTSALLLTAGFLLALNSIRNKRYNLPFWIGILEIIFGTCLCFKYFIIGFIFAIAYFLGDMISKRKYKLPFRKFFWYFRPFVLVFVLIILAGLGTEYYSYSVNHSSAEISDYYEYSKLCDTIDYYPFPDYSEYQEKLKEVGINSLNDYEMLINGYYDKDTSLNNKALSLVAKIQTDEHSYNIFNDMSNIAYEIWNHIASFDSYFLRYVFIAVTAVLYIVFQKKRYAFFPVFYLFATFASCLLIRFLNLFSAYNMYGIWLMLSVYLIFSFDFDNLKNTQNRLIRSFKPITCVLISAIICAVCVCVYFANLIPIQYDNKPSNLYTEIDRHPERYYVLDPITADELLKFTDNYTHPLWGIKDSFLDNVDGFGYFHQDNKMRERNLPVNIYEAILNKKNVFVVDNRIIFKKERYFNRYYVEEGKYASYKEKNEINGYKIYSVEAE